MEPKPTPTDNALRNLDAAEQLLGEFFLLADTRRAMRGTELRQHLANVFSCICAARGYLLDGNAPFGDDISLQIMLGMRGDVTAETR